MKNIVYKITNIINDKLYFGVTQQELKIRWQQHKCNSNKKSYYLYNAIRKYGFENFQIEIVFEAENKKEMLQKEIEFISLYKTNEKIFGYNNSTGGESSRKGCKVSQETKNKISEYQKNRKRKPHSKETKTAMSLSAKGRDMSKAIKSSANKRRGKKAYNIKSVYSVNSKNQINNYESITDASKKTNISISSISNNLSNKTKTAGGLIWHYQKKI